MTAYSYKVTNNHKDAYLTSLLDYVNTTYARLYEVFGKPISGSGDGKVNSEWIIKFADGQVATIYDWKEEETPVYEYDWHIGGNNRVVVDRIRALVD